MRDVMYLKKLELHGFKTFAARTTLDFDGGVTAVVGPNGSGKSNLADAVRWALGEQSMRNVRCRRPEDLIFAGAAASDPGMGTGTRGARAPMGMAEVMMTFDNADGGLPIDYGEVRIGRRLYRTGESEYLLNGARVRLRDVTDLLARAAISSGGHLIIGQGLVDTVLSQRPEERRALVETLAGLRFYYSRRDDAETRLRTADANLQNVDVMVSEAAPHLAILREQAAAYGQYHTVERELRDVLLLHYADALARATEKRDRLAGELTAATATLTAATTAVGDAEGERATLRDRARGLSGERDGLRGRIRAAREAREGAERALAVGQARHEAAVARLDDLTQAIPALETRHAEAVAERADAVERARTVEAERATLQTDQEAIERAVQEATGAVGAAERDGRALAGRRRVIEGQAAVAAAELAALDREDDAARVAEARSRAEEQATARGLREAAEAVVAARAALDAAGAAVETARAAEARSRLEAGTAAKRARTADKGRRDAARRAEELRARAGGLRAWLQAASGGGGGPTVAAALVSPPDIAPALAAALGPVLAARQGTHDMDAGAGAAALAAGARGILLTGRGPLARTAQQALEDGVVAAGVAREAVVGWGDALASVDGDGDGAATLRAALSYALVLRDLASLWRAHGALREAGPSGATVVLATPGGEALLANGLLYRPAGEGAAALERARELRAVTAEADAAGVALQAALRESDAAEGERQRTAAAAETALRTLRAAEHERGDQRNRVTAAERAETQARREAGWAAEHGRRAVDEATARADRRVDATCRRQESHGALTAVEKEEGPAAARYEAARAALQRATARRAEHGAARALVSERASDAARRRTAAEAAVARLEADLAERRTVATRLREEVRRGKGDRDALVAQASEAADALRALHRDLGPIEAALASGEQRGAALEEELAALRSAEARARAAHEAAALAGQQAEHERDSVLSGIEADLALDPIDLPSPTPGSIALTGLPGRIKALRARLAGFGPVNARAPEDLAAAAERQDFLQAQSADLREGIAQLRGLIAEANATVRERFGAVAGELDAQFRLYLQRLFGGGRGELTALYDAAGLPSGLDVHVQPPGKRTNDLALLSGGERALVGLALVFAMLAVRPVPFCVLDEAEAALDEANTLRVGEILRDLSLKTQFVVITHNRGTMAHADALYGVTMIEGGVSQVAGLRLDDLDVVRESRAG